MKKPNLLIVMTDQMRASTLGFMGQEEVRTPNLDRFAELGTTFSRAISNYPVCTPARASLITGLHALSHGLVNNDVRLGTNFKTLAHYLNEMDYKCGYIGKWHMDCEDRGIFIPPGPRRQGFDDFWAGYNCNHQYFQGYYYLNDNPEPIWIDGYEPFEQTRIAQNYLKVKKENNESFCLVVSYGPPHCPYDQVPQEYRDLYPPESIRLKKNAEGVKSVSKKTIGGYYAHITGLDECFGRLLHTLDQENLSEDTIVLFTSDHGDMLFSQDRGWKGKPWLESINIPFIIRWTNHIPENKISDGLIGLVDVMPTLVSLIGGKKPQDVEGKDLSLLILGDESASPNSAFIGFPVTPKNFSYTEWRGIITREYSYARFRDRPWILYHDAKDPYQLRNLIDDPMSEPILKDLDGKLHTWLEILNDPFESSLDVADKYSPGHIGGVVPYYYNNNIKKGIAIRKLKLKRRNIRTRFLSSLNRIFSFKMKFKNKENSI